MCQGASEICLKPYMYISNLHKNKWKNYVHIFANQVSSLISKRTGHLASEDVMPNALTRRGWSSYINYTYRYLSPGTNKWFIKAKSFTDIITQNITHSSNNSQQPLFQYTII